jgi:cbb3-type cytochrome oxidase maturation protein
LYLCPANLRPRAKHRMRAYSKTGSQLNGAVIAPLWRRAIAWALDALLVLGLEFIVGMIIVGIYALVRYSSTGHLTLNFSLNERARQYNWLLPVYLVTGYILYHTLLLRYWHGRTPGRAFLLICIVPKTGDRLALWQSLARTLLQPISIVLALLGYLAFLWSRTNSSLHDLAAQTVALQEEIEHRLIRGTIEQQSHTVRH